LAALKVFIFHLTREAASVNPMEPFLPSRTSEFNIDAAIEDLLDCEPRLVPGTSELSQDWVCSFSANSCKACDVSVCPEVEGVGKCGALAMETRLEREVPGSPEGGAVGNCEKEAVEDLRRLLVSKGGRASG